MFFNDALNTFYLQLYGVGHMVKDHSDSERGNPLPPHGLLFLIHSKVFFYMHHSTDRIAYTTAFVTPVVEHWLEREIAQWVHHEGSIRRPSERSYHGATSRSSQWRSARAIEMDSIHNVTQSALQNYRIQDLHTKVKVVIYTKHLDTVINPEPVASTFSSNLTFKCHHTHTIQLAIQ